MLVGRWRGVLVAMLVDISYQLHNFFLQGIYAVLIIFNYFYFL